MQDWVGLKEGFDMGGVPKESLEDDGGDVKAIRLPRRSPNLNSFAERWMSTANELCVDRMIFFGESS